jgi:hypothetical protein
MIETLEQGFVLALALSAIALYLWVVFTVSAWLWNKFVASVDARIYHPTKPVSSRLAISIWEAAKETPVMFFAPAILLWRWLKKAMKRYMKAVDQLA